ncbi:MAG: hypothetical protein K0R61_5540 [Microvirga sp.]|nr:hypothetical protein [Microvirga sp.]
MPLMADTMPTIAAVTRRIAGECDSSVRIAPEGDQRIAQRDAILVPAVEPGRVEATGERGRSGEIGRKTHVLLVAEGHDLDGTGRRDPLLAQSLDHGDAEHHAEIAVIAACIDDGIDMGADEKGGGVGVSAFEAADHRAERIDMGIEPCGLHQAERFFGGFAMSGRQIEPRDAAGLVRVLGEILDHRHHAAAEGEIGGVCHRPESFRNRAASQEEAEPSSKAFAVWFIQKPHPEEVAEATVSKERPESTGSSFETQPHGCSSG